MNSEVKTYKNKEMLTNDLSTVKLPKIRNEFIAKLENALMFLSYKNLQTWHSDAIKPVHLNQFDGAWLVDISLRHGDGENFTFKPFDRELQVTPDMFPSMNIKTMNLSGDVGMLRKVRLLGSKEKRHLAKYRYIFSEKAAFLDYGKQRWWSFEDGYGFDKFREDERGKMAIPIPTSLSSGHQFDSREVFRRMKEDVKNPESYYMTALAHFHVALQLSLTYYYEWSCYIKETPDSLGVRIPIHPSSSKEVFMMRNIPEGKSRRRAIVNYVKDHYRTITDFNDKERQILIKKHFRGELKFKWRGLEVHVTPSPYDLKMIKTKKKFILA